MWTKFFHEAYLILSVEINFSTVWLQDENNWKKRFLKTPPSVPIIFLVSKMRILFKTLRFSKLYLAKSAHAIPSSRILMVSRDIYLEIRQKLKSEWFLGIGSSSYPTELLLCAALLWNQFQRRIQPKPHSESGHNSDLSWFGWNWLLF